MPSKKLFSYFPDDSRTNFPPEGPLSGEKDLSARNSELRGDRERQSESICAMPKARIEFSLESMPRTLIFKYHLPREKREGKWYDVFYRFVLKGSIRQIKKHLLWKALFDQLTVAEYLLLDHCIQQSWRESREAGSLPCEIFVQHSLASEQRVHKLKMDQKIARIRPSAKLISLTGSVEDGDENSSLLAAARLLKLPDKVNKDLSIFSFKLEARKIPEPPPTQFIGKGYKDHGSMKQPHELGFEIQSGEHNTDHFDSVVLDILRSS